MNVRSLEEPNVGLNELILWPETRLAPRSSSITGMENREQKLICVGRVPNWLTAKWLHTHSRWLTYCPSTYSRTRCEKQLAGVLENMGSSLFSGEYSPYLPGTF